MRRLLAVLMIGSALLIAGGCGSEESTTTIIRETVTTAPPTAPQTRSPSETSSPSPAAPRYIEGIFDGPVDPPISAETYYQDMRAWTSFSLGSKVALARLFIQNNPEDCAAPREILRSLAGKGIARGLQRFIEAGESGGQQISQMMHRYCLTEVGD